MNNNIKLKINPIPPDMNKENVYRALIEENEQLKNNIIKLKEYYHSIKLKYIFIFY